MVVETRGSLLRQSSNQSNSTNPVKSTSTNPAKTASGNPLKKNGNKEGQAQQKRGADLENTPNFLQAMALVLSRKVLFLDALHVAIFYVVWVGVLSFLADFFAITIDENSSSYFVQKRNIFNQYGTKLGWFWTCAFTGPFIWYSSRAHYRDKDQSLIDICRLGVATICWYASTTGFHKFAAMTSRCSIGGMSYSRTMCSEKHGVWIPGFDISGHCFLMIYSILVMTEEASAFRHWIQTTNTGNGKSSSQKAEQTKLVQYFFLAMAGLSVFWFCQICVSVIYYHDFLEEVIGTSVAIFCWFITYRILYPAGLLQPPIRRRSNSA